MSSDGMTTPIVEGEPSSPGLTISSTSTSTFPTRSSSIPTSRRSSLVHNMANMEGTTRRGQCTHMTMTRYYTQEYRCSICLRLGSMGWLYRCTQDRELLIEKDLEQTNKVPFTRRLQLENSISNSLPQINSGTHLDPEFPRPTAPTKRVSIARSSSILAFLDEIGQDHLDQYTPEQMQNILERKTQVRLSYSCSILSIPHPHSSRDLEEIISPLFITDSMKNTTLTS